METKNIIASQLDKLMKGNSFLNTQERLGTKTGIAPSTIFRIRRAKVNATADHLKSIADAFNVPLSYLFGEEDVENGEKLDLVDPEKIKRIVAAFCDSDEDERKMIMGIVNSIEGKQEMRKQLLARYKP